MQSAQDYDRIGHGYSAQRRPDPRIAGRIDARLVGCRSLINVGAGAGSYEPLGRTTVAVEPSEVMIAQRAGDHAPAVQATAERLPFQDGSFDAALAVLTMQHWPDWRAGARAIFPPVDDLCAELGGATAHVVPIPHDCCDGFLGAFWRRPQAYLDARVRAVMSTFLRISDVEERIARLARDLESGAWHSRNASLHARDELDIGYRIVVADY